MVLAEETTEFGASQDHVELADKDGIEGSHVDTDIPADEILQDGWSCLKYIEVDVEGLTDTVIALNDSGCQLCAVNAYSQIVGFACVWAGKAEGHIWSTSGACRCG